MPKHGHQKNKNHALLGPKVSSHHYWLRHLNMADPTRSLIDTVSRCSTEAVKPINRLKKELNDPCVLPCDFRNQDYAERCKIDGRLHLDIHRLDDMVWPHAIQRSHDLFGSFYGRFEHRQPRKGAVQFEGFSSEDKERLSAVVHREIQQDCSQLELTHTPRGSLMTSAGSHLSQEVEFVIEGRDGIKKEVQLFQETIDTTDPQAATQIPIITTVLDRLPPVPDEGVKTVGSVRITQEMVKRHKKRSGSQVRTMGNVSADVLGASLPEMCSHPRKKEWGHLVADVFGGKLIPENLFGLTDECNTEILRLELTILHLLSNSNLPYVDIHVQVHLLRSENADGQKVYTHMGESVDYQISANGASVQLTFYPVRLRTNKPNTMWAKVFLSILAYAFEVDLPDDAHEVALDELEPPKPNSACRLFT